MRIGIDVRCLAEGKHTGVEEYTHSLLRALFERDRDNRYILFFNAWQGKTPDFSWAEHYPNVTVRRFRFPNKLLNLSLWYLRWPRLDRLMGGVDVFFLPNLNFAAVSKDVKLVVTAHDLSFEYFPETFSWKQRIWHFLIDFRRLLRRADMIIAVSESTKADLSERYGLPADRITVIHSGIGERFSPIDRNNPQLFSVQAKYRLPFKFIFYLGTFEPRKNILSLLWAFETFRASGHPDAEKYALVLAGSPGWKSEALFEALRHSPVREHIRVCGFIEDVDKPAVYSLASVFVYPSWYEGFGFPPLEAMACGVPVVTSHSSSLPEIVGEAGVLIDPYQPDEIRLALEQVLLHPEFCQNLREAGLKRSGQFSWKKTAELTHRLLLAFGK